MIKIRKATQKDLKNIVDTWKVFQKEHDKTVIKKNPKLKEYLSRKKDDYQFFRKFVQKMIKTGKGAIFLAEDDKEIIAFTLIFIKDNIPVFKEEKYGYISDLYVKKEYRKNKLSSKLLTEAKKWFKKKGMKHMSIGMYPDNTDAYKVYKHWGFLDIHLDMRRKL